MTDLGTFWAQAVFGSHKRQTKGREVFWNLIIRVLLLDICLSFDKLSTLVLFGAGESNFVDAIWGKFHSTA